MKSKVLRSAILSILLVVSSIAGFSQDPATKSRVHDTPIRDQNLVSTIMGRAMPYRIIFPADYV